jgi:hypothetical protein
MQLHNEASHSTWLQVPITDLLHMVLLFCIAYLLLHRERHNGELNCKDLWQPALTSVSERLSRHTNVGWLISL